MKRKHVAAIALALILVLVAGFWLLRPAVRDGSLELIMAKVRADFPQVTQISTAVLAERLGAGEELVLLDVRRAEEFAVSHLPAAIRVEPGEFPQALEGLAHETPIVAYCSVGYRSSHLVEALRDQGFRQAVNLEGSIFRWIAEGRPVESESGPVAAVHPYSRIWAFLVAPEHRAYAPGEENK